MTDHPIIFSAPMVRALLDGRKVMTRRLAWRVGAMRTAGGNNKMQGILPTIWQKIRPGDRLWPRETWRTAPKYDHLPPRDVPIGSPLLYECDDPDRPHRLGLWGKVRQSIFMPRWASRLTLVVTAVRMERLQEIGRDDAIAEGCPFPRLHSPQGMCPLPEDQFHTLWNSLHGKDAWDANPEVVALSFEVHQCNIDQTEIAA